MEILAWAFLSIIIGLSFAGSVIFIKWMEHDSYQFWRQWDEVHDTDITPEDMKEKFDSDYGISSKEMKKKFDK